MSYQDLVLAEQRFYVLLFLLGDDDRGSSERVLRRALAAKRHGMSPDEFRLLADWLKKAGCVTVEELEGIWLLTLTALGAAIARGETSIPGVAHKRDVE